MKNLIALGFISGLAFLAACSSDGSSSGTGGAAGSGTGATGGGGTGGGGTGGAGTDGAAGSATGGAAGSATGGAAGGGGTGGGDACTTCLTTNCTTELGACAASNDCKAIITCAQACTDSTCVDACVSSNPGGKTAWDAVDACATTKCATECA